MILRDDLFTNSLQDLRAEMLNRFAILVTIFSGLGAYLLLFNTPFRFDLALIAIAAAGIAIVAARAAHLRPRLARYGMIAGLHGCLLAAMILYPPPMGTWLPLASLPLTLMSALLVSHSSVFSAALAPFLAALMTFYGYVDYPYMALIALAVFNLAVTRTALATFYTALMWYRGMQKRADDLLQEARDRRAELSQTIKSLEISYQNQRRMQQQLAYARKQAQEARQMKERFAANISHELRTPLNLILGFSEMIYLRPEVYGEDLHLPPKLYRDIDQIHRSSQHLLELIDDVLDLSHIEMSGFSLHFERTDMIAFITETVDIARNLFHDPKVALIAEVATGLPQIEIDRTRIRQVLLNLLNNAQRFTKRGSVTVSVSGDDDQVIFLVADTGIGIPADKLPFVFDEFYQVDYSLSRSHGGAGLGLAITRRFVEAHGGNITLESAEGVGSTFTITLPYLSRTHAASEIHSGLDAPLYGQPAARRDSTVLVVDPDPAVAAMIQRHLRDCQVVSVRAETNLSDEIDSYRPRAIIKNRLPHQEQAILSDSIAIPVPVIECALPSTTWMIDQLGVTACLSKPITRAQIVEQIERSGGAKAILVVDDDRGFVQLVQRSIETLARDMLIYRAYDGQQAMDILCQQEPRPDLVLLDLAMPEMDGFKVIEAMRADPATATIPIVLLTATRYVQDALEHNTEMVIRQPGGLHPAEVLRCLSAVIAQLEPRYEQLFATP